jgi:quinol-cytochrome oxidoreductase complex cytochrome b subunit/mono/diheme cytochrome c family protein
MSVLLIEHIPGGARWRYVWGSCLAFVFTVQLITGLLLMTAYSPGTGSAWSSVYFIQYEMDFGWFIRGLHHFGSQTMVVLLGLHMLQVVIAGAHLPPREVNWWLGLILLGLVLALSLTGYLLPWDQKGYWATQVATNIAGSLPGIGHGLQKVIVGGPEYGNHTLTRFYALHVAILPPLVIIFIVLHLVVFRRHGVTAPKEPPPGPGQPEPVEGWFWPDQAFRDLLVSLVIFGIMVGLVVYGHGHKVEVSQEQAARRSFYDKVAHAGLDGKGANLDAPADPSVQYDPRPEWYFLFLFQLLKYFEGDLKLVGTVVIPNGTLLLLALLPLLGYGRMRRFGHVFGVLVVTALLTGAAALTSLALAEDMADPLGRKVVKLVGTGLIPLAAVFLLLWLGLLSVLNRGAVRTVVRAVGTLVLLVVLAGAGYLGYAAMNHSDENQTIPQPVADQVKARMTVEDKKPSGKATGFRKRQKEADQLAERAVNLAHREGVPAAGATGLLRRDPLTRGPELFKLNCGICHNYKGVIEDTGARKATASDLNGFGTEDWIFRLLKNPGHEDFFGRTGKSDMQEFIESNFAEDKDKEKLKPLARWLASHPRRSSPDQTEQWFKDGEASFRKTCLRCHSYEGKGGTSSTRGPDLTGYGDEEWVRQMIMLPHSRWRYGADNAMPIFRDLEGLTANVIKLEIDVSKEAMLQAVFADPRNKFDGGVVWLLVRKALKQAEVARAHTLMQLRDVDRELIIRWLLRDYRLVFGGEPVGAALRP